MAFPQVPVAPCVCAASPGHELQPVDVAAVFPEVRSASSAAAFSASFLCLRTVLLLCGFGSRVPSAIAFLLRRCTWRFSVEVRVWTTGSSGGDHCGLSFFRNSKKRPLEIDCIRASGPPPVWIVVDIFFRHFISSVVNDNVVVVPPPSPASFLSVSIALSSARKPAIRKRFYSPFHKYVPIQYACNTVYIPKTILFVD